MITQVNTPRRQARFEAACRGRLCADAVMPLNLALFGKNLRGRFYCGPTLALDLGGNTAWAAGHANPDELAAFLQFAGCRALLWDEKAGRPPTGWLRIRTQTIFGIAAGETLPLPEKEPELWRGLTFDKAPSAGAVADFLFADRSPARRDDFYSELCSKRSRGRALVWALEQNGAVVCTVGAYAVHHGQAYMACGMTAESLRGRGIGGRLIVQMANELSVRGLAPLFLCSPERVRFYARLGFRELGALARYEAPPEMADK